MTPDEFKRLHGPGFADLAPAFEALLVDHLLSTCLGAECTAEKAQGEAAAAKAIANMVMLVRSIGSPSESKKLTGITKPLKRFSGEKPSGGQPPASNP